MDTEENFGCCLGTGDSCNIQWICFRTQETIFLGDHWIIPDAHVQKKSCFLFVDFANIKWTS